MWWDRERGREGGKKGTRSICGWESQWERISAISLWSSESLFQTPKEPRQTDYNYLNVILVPVWLGLMINIKRGPRVNNNNRGSRVLSIPPGKVNRLSHKVMELFHYTQRLWESSHFSFTQPWQTLIRQINDYFKNAAPPACADRSLNCNSMYLCL